MAANHCSHLDPVFIGCASPRQVRFLAKSELFAIPILGWLIKMLGTIPVRRGKEGSRALDAAKESLKHGVAIAIFPEGTRSRDGRLQRGRSGASVLALQTGASVLPVGILGTHQALGKGMRWIKPTKVRVRFGKPIHVEKIAEDPVSRERSQELTARIMKEIEALLPDDMRPIVQSESQEAGSQLPLAEG